MQEYILQLLYSINFTDSEIGEFCGIIVNAIDQSKDPESQIAYSLNYKYIDSFNLISRSFGGDLSSFELMGALRQLIITLKL